MVRMRFRSLAALPFSFAVLIGCSAAPEDATSAEELGGGSPVILVPTATAEKTVASVCAGELDATYCSAAGAAAATKKCLTRLGTSASTCGGACLGTYDAHRTTTCHTGPTYPTKPSCDAPVADDCSFYRACLETAHPCGESGYALDFGERLCYAFVEKRARFTSEGQAWLRGIRTCLQTSIVPTLHHSLTCDALTDEAYAAHAGCYTAKDNSICDLPASDVLGVARILGTTLLSSRSLAQIRQVATHCVLEGLGLAAPSAGAPSPGQAHAPQAFFAELARAAESPDTFRAFVDDDSR